jgi:hypothetical protein
MNNQTFSNDRNNRGQDDHFELKKRLRSIWLGRRDSNPRMPGPKPGALPLGHVPLINCYQVEFYSNTARKTTCHANKETTTKILDIP